jgi:hypothetical protein
MSPDRRGRAHALNPSIKHIMKLAIIVLSDPKSGSDEALGRVSNALAQAYEFHAAGDEVNVVFSGPGTRWPAELSKLTHPANALFNSVREVVKGASCGCAQLFGATEGVKACGLSLLDYTKVATLPPGIDGVAGLRRYYAEGWHVLTF